MCSRRRRRRAVHANALPAARRHTRRSRPDEGHAFRRDRQPRAAAHARRAHLRSEQPHDRARAAAPRRTHPVPARSGRRRAAHLPTHRAGARDLQADRQTRMSGKLYIRTFGCQMNEYDSEKMADVLREARGLETTNDPNEADVILFNTCSVREKAQERVFHDLGRVKHLKRARPGVLIGVGGCVASQEGAAIVARAPYVDLVFGPQTLHRLPEMIEARRASGKAQVDISFPEVEKFDHLPPARVDGVTAFVSIMEGCSKYCTFCVVPYTRGEEVSRGFESVLTEVAEVAAQGVKEVTLLGQNVNAYRGPTEDKEIADFAQLLEYVAEIPGIERIRYTTSHPREFSPRLIDTYAKLPQLVSHVHLPVQSGS